MVICLQYCLLLLPLKIETESSIFLVQFKSHWQLSPIMCKNRIVQHYKDTLNKLSVTESTLILVICVYSSLVVCWKIYWVQPFATDFLQFILLLCCLSTLVLNSHKYALFSHILYVFAFKSKTCISAVVIGSCLQ